MATELHPSPLDQLRFTRQPVRTLRDGHLWGEELLARPAGVDDPIARENWFARRDAEGMLDDIDAEAVGVASGLMKVAGAAHEGAGAALLVNCSFRSTESYRWKEAIELCACQNPRPLRPLTVEFTERNAPGNLTAAVETSKYLRELGFGVALDDVGASTGHHLISMFETLQPTVVKLSGDLVRVALTGTSQQASRAEAELRGYVSHAKALGIQVIMEGIEGPEHWALASDLEVDAVQGLWVGVPC